MSTNPIEQAAPPAVLLMKLIHRAAFYGVDSSKAADLAEEVTIAAAEAGLLKLQAERDVIAAAERFAHASNGPTTEDGAYVEAVWALKDAVARLRAAREETKGAS